KALTTGPRRLTTASTKTPRRHLKEDAAPPSLQAAHHRASTCRRHRVPANLAAERLSSFPRRGPRTSDTPLPPRLDNWNLFPPPTDFRLLEKKRLTSTTT
ncbi:Hypothetical predicted protein, partial [Xyrichtys novacula]